jgi:anthranilate/para-aminobenzoate synthase component II
LFSIIRVKASDLDHFLHMLLILDNYDSFTYNLVQYFGELGAEMKIFRNDALSVEDVKKMAPERICISPGPCTPNEAGISLELSLIHI